LPTNKPIQVQTYNHRSYDTHFRLVRSRSQNGKNFFRFDELPKADDIGTSYTIHSSYGFKNSYSLEIFHDILVNNFISVENKKRFITRLRVYSHQLAREYFKRLDCFMKQRK